jgi:hypothetical protein
MPTRHDNIVPTRSDCSIKSFGEIPNPADIIVMMDGRMGDHSISFPSYSTKSISINGRSSRYLSVNHFIILTLTFTWIGYSSRLLTNDYTISNTKINILKSLLPMSRIKTEGNVSCVSTARSKLTWNRFQRRIQDYTCQTIK